MKFLLTFIITFLVVLFDAFIGMTTWNWLIPLIFPIKTICIAEAIALSIVYSVLFGKNIDMNKYENNETEILKRFGSYFIKMMTLLIIAFIVRQILK